MSVGEKWPDPMSRLATPQIIRRMPRQDRSRALVEAVVEAAAQILVRDGRDGLTTNAVAMRAGVSIGSLYQYFPNRDAILAAVTCAHLSEVYQRIASVDMRDAECLADATARIISGMFASHRINSALHCALAREIATGQLSTSLSNRRSAQDGVIALFNALHPKIYAEIRCPGPSIAIGVVAEIAHALAHAAIERTNRHVSHNDLEAEAVRVVLSYLRTA
jgi:DNA-binding transcriptional regulator YbjK